jgi:hypothetical protein
MATASSGSRSRSHLEAVAFWAIIASAGCFYFWTACLDGVPCFSHSPDGSYNLQAEGFRHGHLNMEVAPNPALLALPDPYDPVANAPYRIHDLTLWHGKYYLYFGVAPVLLVFLPFRLLTGLYVTEPATVAFFTSLGLLLAALLLRDVRRHWYPCSHPAVFLALVAVLGFGCPVVFLDQMPQFYQVPISCAFAFGMAGLFCIAQVLASASSPTSLWLLASGACMGMTLASRPNYVLAMPLLLLPAWWCVRSEGGWRASWPRWQRPAAAAFGPVAVIGLALLAYNLLRFGNPFEFGMRYQLAGQSFVNFTPLAPRYFPSHFSIYTWKQLWWLPYFPFVESEPEVPFGLMRYIPLVWLGLLAFWSRGIPRGAPRSSQFALAGAIAWLAVANLVMDSIFFFAPELRYVTDFAPAFLLLGSMGALAVGQSGPTARWTVSPLVVAALASVIVVMCVYVQRSPEGHRPARLERFSNRMAANLGRGLGQRYGALRLEVEFPKAPSAEVEPLFQTGHGPDRRDWLQVHYLPQGAVQLGLFHAGLGEILAAPVSLPPDRRLVIEVESSAFLPPASHPMFDSWTSEEVAAAQRTLRVSAAGSVVLSSALPAYPSRPWDLQLGMAGFPGDAVRPKFSGRVISAEIVPEKREELPPRELNGIHGVLDLRLQLPAVRGGFEPLIAAGSREKGDLLYLVYGNNDTVQFALDTFGKGVLYSRPVTYSPTEVFTLRAWMGAWGLGEGGRAKWLGAASPGIEQRFFVSINGMVIFDLKHSFNPGADSPTALGWNRIGSGAAAQEFTGRITGVSQEGLSALPAMGSGGKYGAVDMRVLLPAGASGKTEPLVTTGEPGSGDILFVRYVDESHVSFGLDTGGGGPSTDPLEVDYGQAQHIEISMGSLYPPHGGGLGGRVIVRLNGEAILDGVSNFHPSTPEEVHIGVNSIGGANCGWEFTGHILSLERPDQLKR